MRRRGFLKLLAIAVAGCAVPKALAAEPIASAGLDSRDAPVSYFRIPVIVNDLFPVDTLFGINLQRVRVHVDESGQLSWQVDKAGVVKITGAGRNRPHLY